MKNSPAYYVIRLIVLSVIILLAAAGCVTQRKCNAKFPPSRERDSVYIEKLREIPVILPGDTITIDVPVNCPDQDLVQSEFSNLRQQLVILHGRLIARTTIKPDTIKVKVPEIREVVKEVTIPQPVKYIPEFYKRTLLYAIFMTIILGLITYFKVKKIFKSK